MKATAAVKIGPISARFSGAVHLSDLDPPNGYTIGGEGQGGVAGFAKGGAKVRLEDAGTGTLLRYEVHAQVGGKIAQLGARLIDASAKQMADAFFDRFSARGRAAARCPRPPPSRTSNRGRRQHRRHRCRPRRSARSRWCRASRSACRWSPGSAGRSICSCCC